MASETNQMLRGGESLEERNLASYSSAPGASGTSSFSNSTFANSAKNYAGNATASAMNYASQAYNETKATAQSYAGQVYNDTTTSAKNFESSLTNGTSTIYNTSPDQWNDVQFLSVASAVVALWTLLVMICLCMKRSNDRQRNDDWDNDFAYMNALNHDKKEAYLKKKEAALEQKLSTSE